MHLITADLEVENRSEANRQPGGLLEGWKKAMRLLTLLGHRRDLSSSRPISSIIVLALALLHLGGPAFAQGPGETYSQGGNDDPGSPIDPALVITPDTLGLPQITDPDDTVTIESSDLPLPYSLAITPIGKDTSSRYFSVANQIQILVGVSADIACNMRLGNGTDICSFDPSETAYYKSVLTDAKAKGLNKIRLLVDYNGLENCTASAIPSLAAGNLDDHPFMYYPGDNGALGFWRLDERNPQFFHNLREVVEFAREQGIFVEVSFFAPWFGKWERGPWNSNQGRIKNGSILVSVGFDDRPNYIKAGTANSEALRQYQKNIIFWTIDALWDQPHVYWEIANEPELNQFYTFCGATTDVRHTVTAAEVAIWQDSMLLETRKYECKAYVCADPNNCNTTTCTNTANPRKLTRPHLIAVQPFTNNGTGSANYYIAEAPDLTRARVSIVNGHYTTVNNQGGSVPTQDLGAITLARTYANRSRILGFNEGKISTVTKPDGSTANGGTAPNGKPEAARAEAWQFMLTRGGTFDHFGYNHLSTDGIAIRRQLQALKNFLNNLPLSQMNTSSNPPEWLSLESYSASIQSKRYYAAMQTPATNAAATYVAYIHNSSSRSNLAFQGYLPQTSTSGYTETLRTCLGAQAGKFQVDWIRPADNTTLGTSTLCWPGSSACNPRNPGEGCAVPWPVGVTYTYDVVLKIRKVPGTCTPTCG